jgi:crossover junction endodeoxyribonuclease RuvC
LRIAAFDLSLTRTGYALNWGKDGPIVGVIDTEKMRGIERLDYIVGEIFDNVLEGEDGATLVVLEGFSYGSKGRAVFDIAGLGWIVRYHMHRVGMPYVEVPPSTLKKYATGKGNANKSAMLAAAIRVLKYQGHDDNEADALWLLHMAIDACVYGGAASLTVAQSEALEAVQWPRAA